jgi:transcriptional regulator with XRE-family HTH domain
MIDRSSEAVSNLERGVSTPSFDTLEALAVALNVTIAELVAEAESDNQARVEAMARLTDAARELDDQMLSAATEIVEVLAKTGQR